MGAHTVSPAHGTDNTAKPSAFAWPHASSLPAGGAGLPTKGGATASASASARARVARFGSSSAHCDELPLRKLERSDRFTIARARREARLIVADAAAEDNLAPRAQREHSLGAEIAHGALAWVVHVHG